MRPQYRDSKGGSGFGPHAYLKAWNRCDDFPTSPVEAAILEARYKAARLSVAPILFSRENPPPKGKVIIVDKKKLRKLQKRKKRNRKAQRKAKKLAEKLERKEPIVL
jgi:hypothetical protein